MMTPDAARGRDAGEEAHDQEAGGAKSKKLEDLEMKIKEHETFIKQLMSGKQKEHFVEEELKPTHQKDMKPTPEYDGQRKDFMAWHESSSSMLRCRNPKWGKIIEWIKQSRKQMAYRWRSGGGVQEEWAVRRLYL